jgi:mRNA-degrading endonuclease RelE of RelBE toxin-antitoxin system
MTYTIDYSKEADKTLRKWKKSRCDRYQVPVTFLL